MKEMKKIEKKLAQGPKRGQDGRPQHKGPDMRKGSDIRKGPAGGGKRPDPRKQPPKPKPRH